jgi:putative ABC transport system permease protein
MDRQSTLLPVNSGLGVALVLLLLTAAALTYLTRLGPVNGILAAGARAIAQLAAVSVVITWVASHLPAATAFIATMFLAAVRTAGRRITKCQGWSWAWAAAPLAVAVGPVLLLLTLTGILPTDGIALIPVAGILLGGALTATALSGRRALDELTVRHGEVEAALALGLPDREARLLICREAAATALIPGLDQTRTVGLVTLPGAFVGMLIGGASPVEAGAVQLFVLIALLAVQATAVAGTLELIARGRIPATTTGTPR